MNINEITDGWTRVQLSRIFKKYVSPSTPVEMLKKKTLAKKICKEFGDNFRPINEVQAAFSGRPMPDEALCALLWEYKDRGKKGYDLTEKFFSMIREKFPEFEIQGPERAGKDIFMGTIFEDYPNYKRPVDFLIFGDTGNKLLAVGLARYDSDRGGAQEDDRTGGYHNCAHEFFKYTKEHDLDTKMIFLNDGPGLLLGSMWNDYSSLEEEWPDKVKVVTLRMVSTRITREWLLS